MYTRRGFGDFAPAGLPLSLALAKINSKIDGVQLGFRLTASATCRWLKRFRPLRRADSALANSYSRHIEGGHTDRAPATGMRAPVTGASGAGQGGTGASQGDPAARAAARTAAREERRKGGESSRRAIYHLIEHSVSGLASSPVRRQAQGGSR